MECKAIHKIKIKKLSYGHIIGTEACIVNFNYYY